MSENATSGPPPKRFAVVTTAQVERTYLVQAKDEDQAKARLRTHIKDAEMLREGVVEEQRDKQTDSTPQKIKDVKPEKPLAAVTDQAATKPSRQKASGS